MAKTKKHTSLYDFLDQSGVLESNDESLIKKARAAYWRNYHKEYKREKRGIEKEYSIRLNKQEDKLLLQEAIKHDVSMSMFVKDAAIAYVRQTFIVPDKSDLIKLEQILSHCYNDLERLMESKMVDENKGQNAIDTIVRIEQAVRETILKPPLLETEIRKAMAEKTFYSETVKKIMQEYDY